MNLRLRLATMFMQLAMIIVAVMYLDGWLQSFIIGANCFAFLASALSLVLPGSPLYARFRKNSKTPSRRRR